VVGKSRGRGDIARPAVGGVVEELLAHCHELPDLGDLPLLLDHPRVPQPLYGDPRLLGRSLQVRSSRETLR
jgi:hypothetical protein